MRNPMRVIVYVVVVWTVCAVFFLLTSFPEAFSDNLVTSRAPQPNLMRQKRYNITPSQRRKNFSHQKRYNATPSSPQRKNVSSKAWLKNFQRKIGNLTALQAERMDIADTNVDYVVTETGSVKILVVNKTIKAAGKKPETARNTYNENLLQTLRLRREDNERRYYTPRKKIVNPINTKFIITGAQICSTDAKYMTILIIVPSTPSHSFVRDAIRSTYGSYSKQTFNIEHTSIEVSVRLLFLVGRDGTILSDRIIKNESRIFGDVVYADFKESYRNLTRKMLIALKWVSVYCSDVDFVMKIDEDVFVNIPQLAKELHRRPYGIKGAIYGFINVYAAVRRTGKWAVSRDEFPLAHYPNYASGNSYVISGNIVPRMFMISEYLPYMPIEDAFITGCLARIVEAKLMSVPGFTFWTEAVPEPCQFVKDKRVSATKVTTTIMLRMWKASNSYLETCARFIES